MDPGSSPLLTDLYQLNMIEAYLAYGETKTAVFELFVRKLPARRGFLVAAGLQQALEFLEDLRFSAEEIDWLKRTGRLSARTLDYLAQLRFTGDVHAFAEGTVFFANEPILRVMAPLPEAQLVEARLINIVHFQSLIASKAARLVLAAPGKLLVDFGVRRAHGAEAGLMAARASYIAGFAGTATVLAGRMFDIPLFGTMAHSYIEAHDDEAVAFERFAHARPQDLVEGLARRASVALGLHRHAPAHHLFMHLLHHLHHRHLAAHHGFHASTGVVPGATHRVANQETECGMTEVLRMTDKLEAEMPTMLSEHKDIAAALRRLKDAATVENKPAGVQFAEHLAAHAQTEEEITYPTALLIGLYVKGKASKCAP